jgi:hypothetical protein
MAGAYGEHTAYIMSKEAKRDWKELRFHNPLQGHTPSEFMTCPSALPPKVTAALNSSTKIKPLTLELW